MLEVEIIDSRGNSSFFSSASKIAFRTKAGLQKAWFKIGKDLRATFNEQVLDKSSKTGRIYVFRDRLGRKRRHQASAPGESPANITGFYRKSIGFNVNGSSELIFGNSAEYAGYLEVGTSRMKKRPGLRNAIDENERNTIQHLVNEIIKKA